MRGETDQAVIDRRGMLLPRAAGAAQRGHGDRWTRGAQPFRAPGRDLLNRVAAAAEAEHRSRFGSRSGRYAAAWSAAAEALYTPGPQPSEHDLYLAARGGVMRQVAEDRQAYGRSRASGYTETTGAFAAYWHQPPLTGWEDAVVDRIALRQVLAAVSPAHRRVLLALAVHGDQESAARALGTTYATYRSRLRAARRAFRVLWHEGETVPPLWGCDRRSYRRGEELKGTWVTAVRLVGTRRRQRTARRREAAA